MGGYNQWIYKFRTKAKQFTATPTISTAVYAVGDRVGTVMTMTSDSIDNNCNLIVQSVCLIDTSKQSKPMSIFFFNSEPSLTSADNAAFDLTDVEMAKCAGHVDIDNADYQSDSASNSIATVRNIGLMITPSSNKNFYALIVAGGAPTYDTTTALTLKVSALQE